MNFKSCCVGALIITTTAFAEVDPIDQGYVMDPGFRAALNRAINRATYQYELEILNSFLGTGEIKDPYIVSLTQDLANGVSQVSEDVSGGVGRTDLRGQENINPSELASGVAEKVQEQTEQALQKILDAKMNGTNASRFIWEIEPLKHSEAMLNHQAQRVANDSFKRGAERVRQALKIPTTVGGSLAALRLTVEKEFRRIVIEDKIANPELYVQTGGRIRRALSLAQTYAKDLQVIIKGSSWRTKIIAVSAGLVGGAVVFFLYDNVSKQVLPVGDPGQATLSGQNPFFLDPPFDLNPDFVPDGIELEFSRYKSLGFTESANAVKGCGELAFWLREFYDSHLSGEKALISQWNQTPEPIRKRTAAYIQSSPYISVGRIGDLKGRLIKALRDYIEQCSYTLFIDEAILAPAQARFLQSGGKELKVDWDRANKESLFRN